MRRAERNSHDGPDGYRHALQSPRTLAHDLPQQCPLPSHHNFFIKMMALRNNPVHPVTYSRRRTESYLSPKQRGILKMRGASIPGVHSPFLAPPAVNHAPTGKTRPCESPPFCRYRKRALFPARPKTAGVFEVMFKSDLCEGERHFPAGQARRVYEGQFRTHGFNICLRYALEALKKRPKTIPTTTFSTATSEKTTQNSGLITRHFVRSQVINTPVRQHMPQVGQVFSARMKIVE